MGPVCRRRLKLKVQKNKFNRLENFRNLTEKLSLNIKMDIEIANVDKLKVAELRALLSSHELDTKGTKPILVARLTSYLESLPPKDPNAPVVEAVAVAAPEADEETAEEPMEEGAPEK